MSALTKLSTTEMHFCLDANFLIEFRVLCAIRDEIEIFGFKPFLATHFCATRKQRFSGNIFYVGRDMLKEHVPVM